MQFRQLLKFYRYVWRWENYVLFARVLQTAWLVRQRLPEASVTPKIQPALFPVIESFYLQPQPHWRLSDAKKAAWFANFIVNFPVRWGGCAQRSLILYRLLNGYGEPARLCIGRPMQAGVTDGHVWVVRLCDGGQGFAESFEPRDRYQIIYTSPLPVEFEI
ncbi:MAG: lasso peptide biosynthesis protein [Blastocatellia bacterium]